MLDEFVSEQKIVSTILKNAVEKNRYSHAYLFETNGYKNADQMALAFAKYLLCPNHYTNHNKCESCLQCSQIDQNTFSEIQIIEPDGLWIKKEQLDRLQKDFMQTAVQSRYRIYIIKNAEKMNVAAANSILKFLEEPEPNIIAILLTDNMYQLLSTIVSRCQLISFQKNDKKNHTMIEKLEDSIYISSIVDKPKLEQYVETVAHFVEYYENKKEDTLLHTQSLWHHIIENREQFLLAFELMQLFYKDILNTKLGRSIVIYNQYDAMIQKISSKSSIIDLTKRLNLINKLKEKIKLNVNQNLLLDEFILEGRC